MRRRERKDRREGEKEGVMECSEGRKGRRDKDGVKEGRKGEDKKGGKEGRREGGKERL